MMKHAGLKKLLHIIMAVAVPVALMLTGVRLLLTNAFVQIEYRTPGFPEDTYGMTQEERLKWAPIALDFLLNDEAVDFLGDLTFDGGSALYNERELSHMVDVKNLTRAMLVVWYALLVTVIGIGVWAWRGGWWAEYRRMAGTGGKTTVILLVTVLLVLALDFNELFTQFHHVFFEGDSWLFLYSDTLIRLFPMRFWRDAFLLVGVFALAGGAGLWYFGGRGKQAAGEG